jgi:hypothetical protein
MSELTLAVTWAGTADRPLWKVQVSRWAMGTDVLVLEELTGEGPLFTESDVDSITGLLVSEAYRMLRDDFRIVCHEHELSGCGECFSTRSERRGPFD